jgi:septal ring factor EnvC (AmiA/AmiB activator)
MKNGKAEVLDLKMDREHFRNHQRYRSSMQTVAKDRTMEDITLEFVGQQLARVLDELHDIKSDIRDIETDIRDIKHQLRDINDDIRNIKENLRDFDSRIARLEGPR